MYVSTATWIARWRTCIPNLDTVLELEADAGVFASRSTFGTATYELHMQRLGVRRGVRVRMYASTQTALVSGARAREECETIVRHVSDMLGCNDVPTVECHLMNMHHRVPYTVRLEDLAKMQIPGVAMEFRRDKPHMLTVLIKDHAKMTKVLVYRTGKMCIHARDPVHPLCEGQRILDMLKPHIHRAAGLPITLKTESS